MMMMMMMMNQLLPLNVSVVEVVGDLMDNIVVDPTSWEIEACSFLFFCFSEDV